jgi:hypothetical protein
VDAQPGRSSDGAVVQRMVGTNVNPAQGGQFAPAGAGVSGQHDQGAVARVYGVGEPVHLRAGEPGRAWRGWLGRRGGEGRGPSSTAAGSGEGEWSR